MSGLIYEHTVWHATLSVLCLADYQNCSGEQTGQSKHTRLYRVVRYAQPQITNISSSHYMRYRMETAHQRGMYMINLVIAIKL